MKLTDALRTPWGLRNRLLAAFAALVVLTTAGVAGAMYVQARSVLLQKSQDTAALALVDQIKRMPPVREIPPSRAQLGWISDALSQGTEHASAVYGELQSPSRNDALSATPELREKVATGSVAWQRVSKYGRTALVIGVPLFLDGTFSPSGIEVYRVVDLTAEDDAVNQLSLLAWLTGGAAMVLAVGLALFAARGVLRPVRELGDAAHRLGEGDLATRLEVRGTDELAGVASTFNDTAGALQRHVEDLRRMEADARRFVADVSHELRTPLAAMTAVADVLEEDAAHLPGDAGRAARLVSQEAHNLTRLVNDLIEISRFDSGAAALVLEDVDLAEAVRATLHARGWDDDVETDLPDGVTARLDPRRLDVIVANLAGNALKHGEPPVFLALRAEAGEVVVEVGDHGSGLDAEVLPHVFDRFYKADAARARSEGSGLGLAIAWENARLHGGSLVAGNRAEGGALFTLRLPDHQEGAS
ncbi:sensor histidine kinase [Amycolatopsis sp. CA-230715]|uniref:sensor histidine kinase n=1 Tax=Amycolatopsis sp. CA-230715 TaxID=2745196 RepID=UPI001C32C66D|nr:HAMP domain-containing sensor histidine kinase [Amycolatopsis sp. CA-230715]QWF76952.1 Adaptive-response sensory-kinase SasA [Amycolatopsis sp. CA-230715]